MSVWHLLSSPCKQQPVKGFIEDKLVIDNSTHLGGWVVLLIFILWLGDWFFVLSQQLSTHHHIQPHYALAVWVFIAQSNKEQKCFLQAILQLSLLP